VPGHRLHLLDVDTCAEASSGCGENHSTDLGPLLHFVKNLRNGVRVGDRKRVDLRVVHHQLKDAGVRDRLVDRHRRTKTDDP
jgi:hypothetical protein